MEILSSTPTICYHCGNDCPDDRPVFDEKSFCCEGCQTVYRILREHQLCQYYSIAPKAGNSRPADHSQKARFAFLDHPDIVAQLLTFSGESVARATFSIPGIHCSSCLWLLEHLYRIHPGIRQTRVDFLKKQLYLTYNPARLSLRQVVELLSSLGYEPLISLNDGQQTGAKTTNRAFLYRLGVAGFCAGNIMLFSFPEYLGLDDPSFKYLFGLLNLLLAIPVVFYSASGYFESVWAGLKKGVINLDFPILLGILVAFFRGGYEVLVRDGAGYFDSLVGLIFLLLCGKWFQQRTHALLSFERDYKSYFPLAVTRLEVGQETAIPVAQLRKGDRIRVRNHELIPADGLLYRGQARVDYSFVTGESEPEPKTPGALLYAGGRQVGEAIEIEVVRKVSQTYLTQLWNNDVFRKDGGSRVRTFADTVGKYFTLTVIALATLTGLYWYYVHHDPARAVNAFTAVLIIACPCALSLSYPFALGNALRLLGKRHLYLKNAEVVEQMAACDTIVFDKTGTLTEIKREPERRSGANRYAEAEQEPGPHRSRPHWLPANRYAEAEQDVEPGCMSGAGTGIAEEFSQPLTNQERAMVFSMVRQSAHPLSRKLSLYLAGRASLLMDGFSEVSGQGIRAMVDGRTVKLGRRLFVDADASGSDNERPITAPQTAVHLSIDHQYRGCFSFPNQYRTGLDALLTDLQKTHKLFLLSGDNDQARTELARWFPHDGQMHFNCRPPEKLAFIQHLRANGHRVMMVGDGLNDAGALKQADVGIALTDDTLQFTPASDAILEAASLGHLPGFLRYCRFGMRLIRTSFSVSLLYNCVGLTYALTGNLSPVVAAILMPVSSATMLAIATLGMRWRGIE